MSSTACAQVVVEELAQRTKAPKPQLAEFDQGLFSKLRGRFRNS